ncbi:MAG: DUF2244 domain-containing protein [Micropepsaceae bacterium]
MDRPHASFDAVIHPYRSLGPFGFRLVIGVLIAVNAAFAGVMISQGAWPVAGFLGLDVLAVYGAFRLSYAQARAFERFVIEGETLTVERVDKDGARREWSFPAYWVSVWVDDDEVRPTVTLRSHGRSLEIGSYLAPFERKDFAAALRKALNEAKASPALAQA